MPGFHTCPAKTWTARVEPGVIPIEEFSSISDHDSLPFRDTLPVPLIPNDSFPRFSQPRLSRQESLPIRSLPGFKKSHRVPNHAGPAASRFLSQLVAEQLQAEFQQIHRFLRDHFGLRRRDIEVTLEDDGCAILESRLFRLEKSFSIRGDSPDEAWCEIRLDQIHDLNLLAEPAFEVEFPFLFLSLEVDTGLTLDIGQLIDHIEDHPEWCQDLELDYDFQATRCELRSHDSRSSITFRPHQISLSASRPSSGPQLVRDYAYYVELLQRFMEVS